MLRSYWLPLVAAAGLVSLAGGVKGEPINQHASGQNTATQSQKVPAPKGQPSDNFSVQDQIHSMATALEGIEAKIPPQDDSAERSASAEEWGSKWALGMLIVAAIETAITGLGVYLVYRTLREAQRSADEARRAADAAEKSINVTRNIGQAQVRAYLAIENIKATFSSGGTFVDILFSISNSGNSPARNVNYHVDVAYVCASSVESVNLGYPYDTQSGIIIPPKSSYGEISKTAHLPSFSSFLAKVGMVYDIQIKTRVSLSYIDVFNTIIRRKYYFSGYVSSNRDFHYLTVDTLPSEVQLTLCGPDANWPHDGSQKNGEGADNRPSVSTT